MTELRVRDLMTRNPFTLLPEASLAALFDLMRDKNVRHVPIVDYDGSLLALAHKEKLDQRTSIFDDALPMAELRQLMRSSSVEEIMDAEPETINPDEDINAAGELMIDNKFDCLAVTEGGQLVGVLTRSDFVRYVMDTNVMALDRAG